MRLFRLACLSTIGPVIFATLLPAVPTGAPLTSVTGTAGAATTSLTVSTSGRAGLALGQGQRDGSNIKGVKAGGAPTATAPTDGELSRSVINSIQTLHASLTPASAWAPAMFVGLADPILSASRLTNFSVRATAGSGEQTLIVGFSIGGVGTKQILLRAVGPTLAQFGVANALAGAQVRLFNGSSALVGQNDNWGGNPALTLAFNLVGAFALPANSKDAALAPVLAVGGYTAQVSGVPASGSVASTTGVVQFEFYDTDAAASAAQVLNLSARNQVGVGDDVLIVGFVVTGGTPKQLLIRGVGPGLAQFGVAGALADPQLAVFDAKGATVAQNDNWGGTATLSSAFTQAGAFPLPTASKDAAIIVTLSPGVYTAQVSGVGGTTGVAMIELYELP